MMFVEDISVVLSGAMILGHVSCQLPFGRITTFIGESGAGKTTLLKTLVGLQKTTKGSIVVNNKELAVLSSIERAKEIGYVFQDFNLFPHLTVLQNCSEPLKIHGETDNRAKQKAAEALQLFDMQNFFSAYPSQLSGGQKQRVAIARAICLQPKVLLLDEPTASLDPKNVAILLDILKKLAGLGFAIGLSSQDMNFVKQIFDRVYYIKNGHIAEFCDDANSVLSFPWISSFIFS